MPLPHVQALLRADGTGDIFVNEVRLPGVVGMQITAHAGGVPHVAVTLRPDQVLAELPDADVQLVQAGPTAVDFAAQLNPGRLDELALAQMEASNEDLTMAEAFAAAITQMADEFAQARG